jgi:hypothetical protein
MTLFTLKRVLANPKDLPRFVEGQLITAHQLQAIPQAINALEAAVGFPQTTFKAFQLGQATSAGDLNQFIQPLTRLSHRLGWIINLKKFPVRPGALITAQTLNELVDTINALDHRSSMAAAPEVKDGARASRGLIASNGGSIYKPL